MLRSCTVNRSLPAGTGHVADPSSSAERSTGCLLMSSLWSAARSCTREFGVVR